MFQYIAITWPDQEDAILLCCSFNLLLLGLLLTPAASKCVKSTSSGGVKCMEVDIPNLKE